MIGLLLALASVTPTAQCDLPPGWNTVAQRHTEFIVFGETHGTEQAPAFVGQVACALAKRHERLLVAIEQNARDDAAFQPVWAGPDQSFSDALRTVPGWKGRDDGVASEAMFVMLVRLHHLRASGKPIDVVLFNGAKNNAQRALFKDLPGQGPREAAQAENIRAAAAARPYDHILVLTGSVHARKSPVTGHGPTFLPMAMQLASAGTTTTLRFYSGAGTSWNCQPKPDAKFAPGMPIRSDQIECGLYPSRSMATLSGPPFVALGTPPGAEPEGTYDGYVWLGPITGSAPAVPADKP